MAKSKPFSVGDRVLYSDSGSLWFRFIVMAVNSRTLLLQMTQRPDSLGQIRAVNADEIIANAAKYQDVVKHPPRVGWAYYSKVPPQSARGPVVEFTTDDGELRFADTHVIVNRRGHDRKRVRLEPSMALDTAKAVLTNEGALKFDNHGLLVLASRPSLARPGENATSVIRWVGNDAGTTAEERADAWEIQGGWTS